MRHIKESVQTCIRDFLVSQKQGFRYALFFALNLSFIFSPIARNNVAVKKFTRTFGSGIINNWDCSRVISNFYLWICLFAVFLFGFWIFFSAWKQKNRNEEDNKVVSFLDSFMVLGCVHLFLKAFWFFRQSEQGLFSSYSAVIVDFVVIGVFLYIALQFSKSISFDFYLRILISLFSLSFFAVTLLKKTGIRAFAVIVFGFMVLTIVILKLFRLTEDKKLFSAIVKSSSVSLCFLPLMTSLYFELLNIMNSHNLFVFRIRKYYAIASFLLFCCTCILAILIYKKDFAISFWKRIAYPALVLGIAALSTQPTLSSVYGAEIFESANLSIPVSNFLNFGKLPVITCYPGHMMSEVWQAFVYAFLNGDKFGAIFSPYSQWMEFPIISVLFFYFVKTVLNEDTALFSAIVFPFAATSCWNYFGMGMLLALAVIFYVKKQSLPRAFLIWITFVWCALYRLDMGFAFFMAAVVSLAIWCIVKKNKKSAVQLFVSLGITACSGGIVWTILCVLQGVNPALRLFEFLKLSASNQTWAYSNIGNVNSNIFVFSYLIVPFAIAIVLVLCVFSKSIRKNISQSHWILLLIFGFSFFFNMPRGLVRHSLAENAITRVFWDASIFLASSIPILLKKKNFFLPLLALFAIFSIQFVNDSAFSTLPIAESVMPQIKTNLDTERSRKQQRVIFEQDMEDFCETYKYIADLLLKDDETYIDFMNRTFAYSAIGRENPVYVAQSPLMLSGEFTQEMFIKEIADNIDKIPLAFLPMNDSNASASLDGIYNSYRYYKVAEFIYTHYTPLLKYGDFAVWALNGRYDEMAEKVFDSSETSVSMKSFLDAENFTLNNCRIEKDFENETITIQSTGSDPVFYNLNDFVDISAYCGRIVKISLDYETNTEGVMQLFYTTNQGEEYSEPKSCIMEISKSGTASLSFPVTEFTRIRLDTPEMSTVKISAINISSGFDKLDSHYNPNFHTYNIAYLPILWAEKDVKKAKNCKVLSEMFYDGDYYLFDEDTEKNQKGNYFLIHINNQESDTSASFKIGKKEELNTSDFASEYEFVFNVLSGEHDYIFRVSADYLWYLEKVNAVKFEGDFNRVDIKILEAD